MYEFAVSEYGVFWVQGLGGLGLRFLELGVYEHTVQEIGVWFSYVRGIRAQTFRGLGEHLANASSPKFRGLGFQNLGEERSTRCVEDVDRYSGN